MAEQVVQQRESMVHMQEALQAAHQANHALRRHLTTDVSTSHVLSDPLTHQHQSNINTNTSDTFCGGPNAPTNTSEVVRAVSLTASIACVAPATPCVPCVSQSSSLTSSDDLQQVCVLTSARASTSSPVLLLTHSNVSALTTVTSVTACITSLSCSTSTSPSERTSVSPALQITSNTSNGVSDQSVLLKSHYEEKFDSSSATTNNQCKLNSLNSSHPGSFVDDDSDAQNSNAHSIVQQNSAIHKVDCSSSVCSSIGDGCKSATIGHISNSGPSKCAALTTCSEPCNTLYNGSLANNTLYECGLNDADNPKNIPNCNIAVNKSPTNFVHKISHRPDVYNSLASASPASDLENSRNIISPVFNKPNSFITSSVNYGNGVDIPTLGSTSPVNPSNDMRGNVVASPQCASPPLMYPNFSLGMNGSASFINNNVFPYCVPSEGDFFDRKSFAQPPLPAGALPVIGNGGAHFMGARQDHMHPYNSTTHPYNGTTHPYNTTSHPCNGTTHPYNTTTHPYNGTTHPNNSTTHPYNGTTHPYNGTTLPNNSTTHPYIGTTHPYNGTTHPYNNTTHPYNNTFEPFNNTPQLHNNSAHPCNSTMHPINGTKHPYNAISPLGSIRDGILLPHEEYNSYARDAGVLGVYPSPGYYSRYSPGYHSPSPLPGYASGPLSAEGIPRLGEPNMGRPRGYVIPGRRRGSKEGQIIDV